MKKGMNKKAISDIVSTVLIIMIAVAAIGIIGAIVVPMVRNNLGGGSVCNEALADLYIDSVSGFSCVDLTKGILPVQIAKGSALIDYAGATISVISEGNSHMFDISSSFPNSRETFYLNVGKLETIDSIELYPKTLIGKKERVCESSSKIKIPVCELSSEVLQNLVASGENQNLFYDSSSSSSGASSPKIQSKNLPGLVGYWTFDDGDYNSTHVFDQSRNENHGKIFGVTSTEGILGTGGGFDGVENYILLGDSEKFFINTSSPFTITLWMNYNPRTSTTSGNLFHRIITLNAAGTNTFGIAYRSPPKSSGYEGLYITTHYGWARGTTGFHPDPNEWGFLVLKYNGEDSTILSNFKLYWNLQEIELFQEGVSIPAPTTLSSYLGVKQPGDSQVYRGFIDEVLIFNRFLPEEEIKSIYKTQNK
jgi:hypothetical protein